MTVLEADSGLSDNIIECSDAELEALREVAREADGRKSEVKLAREALGM